MPRTTPFDVVNNVRAYPPCSGDVHGFRTSGKFVFYFKRLGLRDSGVSVRRAESKTMSSFRHFVRHVDLMRSRKKVIGITAGRVVAMMENVSAFWRLAVRKFERDYVCSKVFSVQPEPTVAGIFGTHPSPFPTFVLFAFGNVRPKAVEKSDKYLTASRGNQSFGQWVHTRLPLNVICI